MQHANDTTDDALTCHQVDMFNTLVYDHRSIRCLQTAAERLCRSGTFWRNKQPKSPQILEPFTDRRRAQRSLLTFRIKKWIYRHSCWSTRLQECVHRRGVVKFSSLTPDRRQNETISLSKRLWLERRWKHSGWYKNATQQTIFWSWHLFGSLNTHHVCPPQFNDEGDVITLLVLW